MPAFLPTKPLGPCPSPPSSEELTQPPDLDPSASDDGPRVSKRSRNNQKAGHQGKRHHFLGASNRGHKKRLQAARQKKAEKALKKDMTVDLPMHVPSTSATPTPVPSTSATPAPVPSTSATPVPSSDVFVARNEGDANMFSAVGLLESSLRQVKHEYQALQKEYLALDRNCAGLSKDSARVKLQLQISHIEATRTIVSLQQQLEAQIEKHYSVSKQLSMTENIENLHLKVLCASYQREQDIQQKVFLGRISQLEKEKEELEKTVNLQSSVIDEHSKQTVVNPDVDLLEVCNQDGSKYSVRGYGQKGKTFTLVHLPTALKGSSEVQIRNIEKRVNRLYELLCLLSTKPGHSGCEEDIVSTLAQFMNQYPEITAKAAQKAEFSTMHTLSPVESVDLKILLNLPWTRLRSLKTFLNNKGIPLLAPEPLMREDWAERTKNLRPDLEIEVGMVKLRVNKLSPEEKDVAFVRVKDLQSFVQNTIDKHEVHGNVLDSEEFDDKVFLKFGADKGGSSTKLCIQIANVVNCNSAENTELLSFFEGTDSLQNMWKVFDLYKDQFKELKSVSVPNDSCSDDVKMKAVQKFLFGDYSFLCSVMGHQGAAASYPCLWCLVPLEHLRLKNGMPHSPFLDDGTESPDGQYPERSVEMYMKDHAECIADGRNKGDCHKNGKFHHSVVNEMLFPVDNLISVVPLPLHIFLGLGHDAYKCLESECKALDMQTMETYNPELYERWESLSLEVSEKKEMLETIQASVKNGQEMLKALRSSKGKRPRRDQEELCESEICIVNSTMCQGLREQLDWVQCDFCDGWFHNFCLGLTGDQIANLEAYKCPACDGQAASADDIINRQAAEVLELSTNLDTMKAELAPLTNELKTVSEEVKSKMGPLESALGEKLHEIGIDLQAYHSNALVGNHIQKMLKVTDKVDNPSILLEVFLDYPEKRRRHYEYLKRLGKIHSLISSSRFLKDEEISLLCNLCWELGQWFPANFPNNTISPKMHILIFHVPQFVQKWKSVGLFSESGLESIHARMNQINRVYCKIRSKSIQAKLVFQNQSVTSTADRALLKPKKPRKCQICSSWLKCGKCPQC